MGHYDKIEIAGMSTKEVADKLGYASRVLVWELVDKGFTDEEILNYKPKFKGKGKSKYRYVYKGQEYDLFGLVELSGIPYDVLYNRLVNNKHNLKNGNIVAWAVETPYKKK